MIKRVSWFASGVVAGAAGVVYGSKKVKEKAQALKPVNVARSAAGQVRSRVHDVADAVREGRQAMVDKEAELRVRHGGANQVVEAHPPVRPGQVIDLQSLERNGRRRRTR
jgi:hypothetical protein